MATLKEILQANALAIDSEGASVIDQIRNVLNTKAALEQASNLGLTDEILGQVSRLEDARNQLNELGQFLFSIAVEIRKLSQLAY